MEKLDSTQADQDDEIAGLNKEISKTQNSLHIKMDKSDATKIWTNFQRFAEYNDLKDLYTKCIPELAKFEQKIYDF